LCLGVTVEADSPQKAFAKAWVGQPVVLKRVLFTLIYNDRGKLGTTRNGQRDGLLVTTPLRGDYFQFDGRHRRETVVANDPDRLIDS
jgi:hypothetical protein